MAQAGNFPFVRIVIPFTAGVVVSETCGMHDVPLPAWILFAITFAFFSLIVLKVIPLPSYRRRWAFGLLITLVIFEAGFIRSTLYNDPGENLVCPVLQENAEQSHTALGYITSDPEEKSRSVGIELQVIGIMIDHDVDPSRFRTMAYFRNNPEARSLGIGDTIVFRGRFRPVDNAGNPYEFDYRKYMLRKGIPMTIFLDSTHWIKTGCGQPGYLRNTLSNVRKTIHSMIFYSNLDERNKGLALALLVGIKDELDEEVAHDFSVAGAIHVLCVSGLHVGVIFIMICYFFGYLRRAGKGGKVLFTILGLVGVWGYALVTGLPPSVSRASVMFSFILAGKLMDRKIMTMNSVAASAFIILLEDPILIFHIGFQLSYLAVIGIVTLFPILSGIWIPRSRLLVKVRDLLLVSLCAQLFTFPVAVAAFNTFPNYFLLTNMLVIPVTGIVIYAGVAFLALPIISVKPYITWVFDQLLSLMRWMVRMVESIPGSSTDGLSIISIQTCLLLGCVFCLLFWLQGNGKRFLHLSLMILLVFTGTSLLHLYRQRTEQVAVVYNIRGAGVVDIIQGRNRFTLLSSDSIPEKDLQFATRANRIRCGVFRESAGAEEIAVPDNRICMVNIHMLKLVFIRGIPEEITGKDTVDIAVISGNINPDPLLFSHIRARNWVMDGSVTNYRKHQWKETAREKNVSLWDTSTSGAFCHNW